MDTSRADAEAINISLNDAEALSAYKAPFDSYKPGLFPRMLGGLLLASGNLVYGKEPSYLKFRALEVIARVPYHSWASGAFTLLTLAYSSEERAMKLSRLSWFSQFAQENETMHVVVISQLARSEGKRAPIRGTVVPVLFAFFYFWVAYLLYLFSPRSALELNYVFENHAFEQYRRFLETHGDELKKKPILSDYLEWYGRHPRSQYEFFRSVQNDEIVHRNNSIRQIEVL